MRNTVKSSSFYYKLAMVALLLSLVVVMLGAYTRLSDAGLGCPDWPGCYGKLVLPESAQGRAEAQTTFPNQPIVAPKAWKEMIHRYFAGTLAVLILILGFWAFVRKFSYRYQPILCPILLLLMIVFQALLGMWTVTLKVLPLVVMGHLLGGMTIAALLCWLVLAVKQNNPPNWKLTSLKFWAVLGLLIVFGQIFLGAWTSTNYAALACPSFPDCHGTLFPPMEWKAAFNFASPIGPNYEGGRLEMAARVTIQMAHRYGALITFLYLAPLSLVLIAVKRFASLRVIGFVILLLLCLQIILGILNVVWLLPMWTAVMHNGVAALLLLALVTLVYRLFGKPRDSYARVV
jgi:cytochrome c oxidase assembly protein subunit 15